MCSHEFFLKHAMPYCHTDAIIVLLHMGIVSLVF